MLGQKGAFYMTIRAVCLGAAGMLGALPGLFWACQGLAAAWAGQGPAFGPGALAAAWAACLALALGWVWLPQAPLGPDGLLEPAPDPAKTKALLPGEWRGELCSSNVSNQS